MTLLFAVLTERCHLLDRCIISVRRNERSLESDFNLGWVRIGQAHVAEGVMVEVDLPFGFVKSLNNRSVILSVLDDVNALLVNHDVSHVSNEVVISLFGGELARRF